VIVMAHLKRYSMPGYWPLGVKCQTFVVRPSPGPHPLNRCMPLRVVVRDLLGLAETTSEAKRVLNAGKVMVDKRVRKDPGFPVGLMDVVEIPDIGKNYRVGVNAKGLHLQEITKEDAGSKLCMITGKRTLNAGVQISLHDGRNIMLDAGKSYRVGDTVAISLPGQKITAHYKLENGSNALVYSGRNIGMSGVITGIKTRKKMTEKSTAKVRVGGTEIETLKDYIFVAAGQGASPSGPVAAPKRRAKK